jgi:hypothetical protein
MSIKFFKFLQYQKKINNLPLQKKTDKHTYSIELHKKETLLHFYI